MFHDEIEIKLDLANESNYRNILNILAPDIKPIRQENYFFDTERRSLGSIGWVLRLRKEEEQFIITVKGRRKESSDDLTIREEIEEKIDPKKAVRLMEEGIEITDLPPDIAGKIGEVCRGQKFKKNLSFINYRSVVIQNIDGVEVEMAVDRTEFTDGSVDYEFEAELSDKLKYKSVMMVIEQVFTRVGVPLVSQGVSKFGRALKKARAGK